MFLSHSHVRLGNDESRDCKNRLSHPRYNKFYAIGWACGSVELSCPGPEWQHGGSLHRDAQQIAVRRLGWPTKRAGGGGWGSPIRSCQKVVGTVVTFLSSFPLYF